VPADRFATAGQFAAALREAAEQPDPDMTRGARAGPRALLVALALLAAAGFGIWRTVAVRHHPDPTLGTSGSERIAVLYFDERSGDPVARRIAAGLTEDLIDELSGINAFQVTSRSGVRPFRDRDTPFDSMVAALKVTTVVDGSVQRNGDRLRVRVGLIDARSDSYVDSLSIERPVAEFLGIERDVAEQVAAALRRRLGRDVRLRGLTTGTLSPRAKELVLKAHGAMDDADDLGERSHPEDLAAAREALDRADSLLRVAEAEDPGWLGPTIERGWIAIRRASLIAGPARAAALQAGLRLAEEALRRRPASPEALELHGRALWELVGLSQGGVGDSVRLHRAERDLRSALSQDSTLARAWGTLSFLLWYRGRTAEAELAGRRALRVDAYLADARSIFEQLFFTALMLGDYPQARQWCHRGRLSFPRDWRFVQCDLTLLRHDAGAPARPDSAWTLVARLDSLDPSPRAVAQGRPYQPIYRRLVAAGISARAGRTDVARAELTRALSTAASDSVLRVDLLYDEAYLVWMLGDTARAVGLLREYAGIRPMAARYIARDPLFTSLRPPE
jgi:TolB-like protein/tetratricopeptide (TPR) repeat protein